MKHEYKIKSFCVIFPLDWSLGSVEHHAVEAQRRDTNRYRHLPVCEAAYEYKFDRLWAGVAPKQPKNPQMFASKTTVAVGINQSDIMAIAWAIENLSEKSQI